MGSYTDKLIEEKGVAGAFIETLNDICTLVENKKEDKDDSKLRTIVHKDGKYYVVDSCFTFDHGYETMVFTSDEKGNVIDWSDLDCEIYNDVNSMKIGHKKMCEKWSDKKE